MAGQWAEQLKALIDCSTQVSDIDDYVPEEGMASVLLTFSNGTKLRTEYWRLIKGGQHVLSSFDHQKQYGLPAPIDAKRELQDVLESKIVIDAKLHHDTGDIILCFEEQLTLQVLNFTGYEIWEIAFPDGLTEYSNYNRSLLP